MNEVAEKTFFLDLKQVIVRIHFIHQLRLSVGMLFAASVAVVLIVMLTSGHP